MEVEESPINNGVDVSFSEEIKTREILATPELVNEWKKYYLREGHSFHSTTTYYNYIKRFVSYGIKINQKTVDKFREKNMSGACSGALKNFFQYLVLKQGFPPETKYIHFDKSKSTKKFPNSIDPLEVKKLVNAFENIMERNLTLVIYECGLRVSEALKLTWADFNWISWLQDRTKQGSVNLKNTKGNKFRTIPVSFELMEKLYNDHKNRTSDGIPIGGLLFNFGISEVYDKTKTLDENQYNYIVIHAEDRYRKRLYKISKEVLGKRINPHSLRHSFAMDLMNHNVPIESIKRFLGHTNISSTEIYAQASASKLSKDLEEYYKDRQNEKKQTNNTN